MYIANRLPSELADAAARYGRLAGTRVRGPCSLLALLLAALVGCASGSEDADMPGGDQVDSAMQQRLAVPPMWFGGDSVVVDEQDGTITASAEGPFFLQTHAHLSRPVESLEFVAKGRSDDAFELYALPVRSAIKAAPDARAGTGLAVTQDWMMFRVPLPNTVIADVQIAITARGPAELSLKDAVLVFR